MGGWHQSLLEVGKEVPPDLGTVAKLVGARIGLLRVMAETQLQARPTASPV